MENSIEPRFVDASVQTDDCDYKKVIMLMPSLISKIIEELGILMNETKNFNVHLVVFKKLLNLKERKDGQDDYFNIIKNNSQSNLNLEEKENTNFDESNFNNIDQVLLKYDEFKKELQTSHALTSCLVYNVQYLHKELTGIPLNQESAQEMFSCLQKGHDKLRTAEAIFKYELQEKRKMLNKFRDQLESTKEDWKYMRIRNSENETEWNNLREEFAKRQHNSEESGDGDTSDGQVKTPPEADSAFQSESEMSSVHTRRRRLDLLEEQCHLLFSNLIQSANRLESSGDRSDDIDGDTDNDEEDYPSSLVADSVELLDEADFENEQIEQSDLNTEESQQNEISNEEEINFDQNDLMSSTLTTNLFQEEEEDGNLQENSSLANLRKKALETVVSRLKHEKELHEGKQLELKQQLDELTTENKKLTDQISALKEENLIVTNKDSEFRKRAEYIFRQEREAFECRLAQFYESKTQVQIASGILEAKIKEKEDEINSLKQELLECKQDFIKERTCLEIKMNQLNEHIKSENELYETLMINYREQNIKLKEMKNDLDEQENIMKELDCFVLELKESRFKEQQRFWQQLEELEAFQHVRDEECAIFSNEIKRRRKEQDEDHKEIIKLRSLVEDVKSKSRKLHQRQANQLIELKSDNDILKNKVIKLAKEKDLLWKKAHQLINEQCCLLTGRWMNDKDVKKCMKCNSDFSFIIRRHHCRVCGGIYCTSCSNNWIMTAFRKQRSRVCDDCYSRHKLIDTANLETLLYSANTDENNSIIQLPNNNQHADLKITYDLSCETNLPEFLSPQSMVNSILNKTTNSTNFDVIDDDEIVRCLSACSPYNCLDDDECHVPKLCPIDGIQMNLTRYATEIESFGQNGIQGEIWITPECKYAFPILIDSPYKINFNFSSFPSFVGFSVRFKSSVEDPDFQDILEEQIVNSETNFEKEIVLQSKGAYFLLINNCYAKYLATKVKYCLVAQRVE